MKEDKLPSKKGKYRDLCESCYKEWLATRDPEEMKREALGPRLAAETDDKVLQYKEAGSRRRQRKGGRDCEMGHEEKVKTVTVSGREVERSRSREVERVQAS